MTVLISVIHYGVMFLTNLTSELFVLTQRVVSSRCTFYTYFFHFSLTPGKRIVRIFFIQNEVKEKKNRLISVVFETRSV